MMCSISLIGLKCRSLEDFIQYRRKEYTLNIIKRVENKDDHAPLRWHAGQRRMACELWGPAERRHLLSVTVNLSAVFILEI